MPAYTITTPDANEPGVTAAREAYNASIPAEVPLDPPDPENPDAKMPNPDLKADNAAYMQWVMVKATDSYCVQYGIYVATPAA